MKLMLFNPFRTKKYKNRVTCIDFQIRIRVGHGPVTCTRNLTFSPTRDYTGLGSSMLVQLSMNCLLITSPHDRNTYMQLDSQLCV